MRAKDIPNIGILGNGIWKCFKPVLYSNERRLLFMPVANRQTLLIRNEERKKNPYRGISFVSLDQTKNCRKCGRKTKMIRIT